jgi:SAM-dependent methyltransferase
VLPRSPHLLRLSSDGSPIWQSLDSTTLALHGCGICGLNSTRQRARRWTAELVAMAALLCEQRTSSRASGLTQIAVGPWVRGCWLAATVAEVERSDFVPAPNQQATDLYEIENAAFDRRGAVLDAMRTIAPWTGRTLLDLGCGTGYWFRHYADAAALIGVEPDQRLLPFAEARESHATVVRGSAEHIPLPDASVDVVHARFAYFFPPGCEAGLAEVMRVLRPGGTLVVVDNDLRRGEFARLVVASPRAAAQGQASTTDGWWAAQGATRHEVMSDWTFDTGADMEAVLRLELPADIVDPWLDEHPDRTSITYGYVLFALHRAIQ